MLICNIEIQGHFEGNGANLFKITEDMINPFVRLSIIDNKTLRMLESIEVMFVDTDRDDFSSMISRHGGNAQDIIEVERILRVVHTIH